MLPDLEVLAPSVATFGHPEPIFGDSAPDGSSCFGSVFEDNVRAFQRVYSSDGSFAEQWAGSMIYHPIHSHYHFEDFSQSTLHVVSQSGLPSSAARGRAQERAAWPTPRCTGGG